LRGRRLGLAPSSQLPGQAEWRSLVVSEPGDDDQSDEEPAFAHVAVRVRASVRRRLSTSSPRYPVRHFPRRRERGELSRFVRPRSGSPCDLGATFCPSESHEPLHRSSFPVPGPGRSSAAGPFLSAVEHSSIFKGTLHEAAAGYAPRDPFFQNAFHTRGSGGSVGRPEYKRPRFAGPLQSPLTDSNRRPPPYHGGFELVLRDVGTALVSTLSLHFPVCLLAAPFLWKNSEPLQDSPNLSPKPVPTGRSPETLITCIAPASAPTCTPGINPLQFAGLAIVTAMNLFPCVVRWAR
jgi:hypothetical protein